MSLLLCDKVYAILLVRTCGDEVLEVPPGGGQSLAGCYPLNVRHSSGAELPAECRLGDPSRTAWREIITQLGSSSSESQMRNSAVLFLLSVTSFGSVSCTTIDTDTHTVF